MDPITHGLIGLAIAKFTGNDISISDAATISIVVGSIFPDVDIVFQKWGDYVYLKNHRGLTHSILGIMASAALLALLLSSIFRGAGITNLFLWSLIGGLSHSAFDLLNSYGAKLLWPFCNKRFSFGIINSFDPLFFLTLTSCVLSKPAFYPAALTVLFSYIVLRILMKWFVSNELHKNYTTECGKVSLLPSLTSLFKWHFVLEEPHCNVVGEKNILKRNIKIFKVFDKLEDELLNKVSFSYVGRFFSEFTPVFHVMRESMDDVNRYVFVDMRYYMRDDFLHHAVLELDKNDNIVNASFNPYSMNRTSAIPDPDCIRTNRFFSKLVGM